MQGRGVTLATCSLCRRPPTDTQIGKRAPRGFSGSTSPAGGQESHCCVHRPWHTAQKTHFQQVTAPPLLPCPRPTRGLCSCVLPRGRAQSSTGVCRVTWAAGPGASGLTVTPSQRHPSVMRTPACGPRGHQEARLLHLSTGSGFALSSILLTKASQLLIRSAAGGTGDRGGPAPKWRRVLPGDLRTVLLV